MKDTKVTIWWNERIYSKPVRYYYVEYMRKSCKWTRKGAKDMNRKFTEK